MEKIIDYKRSVGAQKLTRSAWSMLSPHVLLSIVLEADLYENKFYLLFAE